MKVIFGRQKKEPYSSPSINEWSIVPYPRKISVLIYSLFIALTIFLFMPYLLGWGIGCREMRPFYGLLMIFFSFILIPFHELFHAIALPSWGSETTINFRWSFIVGRCSYQKELSRMGYIIFLLAPTIILTIFPLFCHLVFRPKNQIMAIIALVNAVCSCFDYFNIGYILINIPRNSVILSNKGKVYWRKKNISIHNSAISG